MQSHKRFLKAQLFVNSQTHIQVPAQSFATMTIREIEANLESLLKDLHDALESFRNPTKRRSKDIKYMNDMLAAAIENKNDLQCKTADKLAVKFYRYLTSSKFTTGARNRSAVRDKLFAILYSYYPEIFSENAMIQRNFFNSIEEFEYASESLKRDLSSHAIINKLKASADIRTKNLTYANSVIVRNSRHESKNETDDYEEINNDLKKNIDEEDKTIELCHQQLYTAIRALEDLIGDLAMQESIRGQLLGVPNRIKSTEVGLTAKDKATYIDNEVKMRKIDFQNCLNEAILNYENKKGKNIEEKRKLNIKDLKGIMFGSEGYTVDSLASEINKYINSTKINTGLLGNSLLRDLINEVLKTYSPTLIVDISVSDQFKRKEHYDDLTDKIEKAFKAISPYCSSIIGSACETVETYDQLLAESRSRKKRSDDLSDQKLAKVNFELLKSGLIDNLNEEKASCETLATQEIRLTARIMLFKRQFDSQRNVRNVSYPDNAKLAKPELMDSINIEEAVEHRKSLTEGPDFR